MTFGVTRQAVHRRHGGERGFTLIELLVVIVILGILAATVVLTVGGVTDRGRASACRADVHTVQVAVEAHRVQLGTYPSAATSDARLAELVSAGFLHDVPKATVGTSGYEVAITDTEGSVSPSLAGCSSL